ncbi:MerR family transcriptional regulator [Streptomyces sp. NPDC002018]|uniref:DNA polymerase III subunit beta family protein n=1 Tax=Streptomyces sp. NPDC002018 TaxID=3364629 RepID=UPI0036A42C7F
MDSDSITMDSTADGAPEPAEFRELPELRELPGLPELSELLSISTFARRVGLAPSALRFYDDCRVLRPARVDGATGYRYYSPGQEPRARLLRGLRLAGLPLADAGVVLDGPAEEARAVLERHQEAVRNRTRTADATITEILRSLSPAEDGATLRTRATQSGATDIAYRTTVRLGGAELASAVRQVVPAVGRDAEHPVLGCVLVEIDDSEVRLVATDRYRLSLRVLSPATVTGPPRRLLLEAAELIETGAWATRHREVTIEAGRDSARVWSTDESVSRVLAPFDGQFPAYREILPDLPSSGHRVIVDRAALLDALYGFEDAPGIALRLGRDEASVSLPDGSRITALPAAVLGDAPLRVGFDPAVLAPALEAGVGPDVLLEISTATRPVLVRSADQGSFTTLVMPIALTGDTDRPWSN